MRGIPIIVAVGLVMGCGGTGIDGYADTIYDPIWEVDIEPDPDPDPDPEPEIFEDIIEDEWPEITEGCGNGIVEDGEECDDGDLDDCDGCSTECHFEQALTIDDHGCGAYIPHTFAPCLPCPYTMEVWFSLEEETSGAMLFEIERFAHISFALDSGNELYEFTDNYETVSGELDGVLSPGTWHHAAMTCWRDESGWNTGYFLDGTALEVRSLFAALPTMPTCGRLFILRGPVYLAVFPRQFNTIIDDLRISDDCIYFPDSPFVPDRYLTVRSDTVALWHFNETEYVSYYTWRLLDSSGHGYHAKVEDGTLVPDDCHLP